MGIGMFDFFLCNQCAVLFKLIVDIFIGVKNELSLEKFDLIQEPTIFIHRGIRLNIVGKADVIVFATMAGCGMNASGSRIERHVPAQYNQGIPWI